jgi:glucokinase
MTGMITIGIDIGGTSIKLGLVDITGRILGRRRIAYATMESFEDLANALVTEARSLASVTDETVAAVGIAAPGYARRSDGVMVDGTANVPLLRGRSLVKAVRERFGRPVLALNDGAAAAFGELHFGAGQGLRRFALITLGTGVGGSVVIDGDVVAGDEGEPPEIGAMVLDADLGPAGTFESFACANGFAASFNAAGGPAGASPEEIFREAAAGSKVAAAALNATCRRIAQAFGTMINLINLQACFIGGGIACAGDPLRDLIRLHLSDFTWPFLLARSRVDLAVTGPDAGMLGAAAWAARHCQPIGAENGAEPMQSHD